jgi:hypothetical protein
MLNQQPPLTARTARDFEFAHHGSITILTPLTASAHDWIEEHIPQDATRWGRLSIAIEPRYVGDIIAAIYEDGLTCQ